MEKKLPMIYCLILKKEIEKKQCVQEGDKRCKKCLHSKKNTIRKKSSCTQVNNVDFFSWDTIFCKANKDVTFKEFQKKNPGAKFVAYKRFKEEIPSCLGSYRACRYSLPSIKERLAEALKVKVAKLLDKKIMLQFEECYLIATSRKTFDENPKGPKTRKALEYVAEAARAYIDSLEKLSEAGRGYLEEEFRKPVQKTLSQILKEKITEKGLSPCPLCPQESDEDDAPIQEFENIEDHLRECHPRQIEMISISPIKEYTNFIEYSLLDAQKIFAAAGKAVEKLEGKGKNGHPRHTGLRECISKLSFVFFEITGKQPTCNYSDDSGKYKGKDKSHFCEFAHTVLSIIFQDPPTKSALAQMAQDLYQKNKSNFS